jgi:ABC-2 type transport system permease protein
MSGIYWTVVKLEWRLLLRDRAARIAVVLLAALLIGSALLARSSHVAHRDALARLEAAQHKQFELAADQARSLHSDGAALQGARDPRDPHAAGDEWATQIAALPPGPLSSLSTGQRDLQPQALHVTAAPFLGAEMRADSARLGPSRLAAGSFDPAFVLTVLFPLVVIALSYDLLSGERERGTLALILAQPVSQAGFVLAKATARASLLLVLSSALGLGAVLVAGDSASGPGFWPRAALLCATLAAHTLFWFAAAAAVNARQSASTQNALALVGLWLVVVIILPAGVRTAVETVFPPPSRVEQVNATRAAAAEAESAAEALEGDHGAVPRGAAAMASARAAEIQAELTQRTQPVVDEFRKQRAAQQALVNTLRFLSPTLVVSEALADVAATGGNRQQLFSEQALAFHQQFRTFFVDLARSGALVTPERWEQIPRFTFRDESFSALAGRVATGLLGLLLPALALVLWAVPRLRRVGRLSAG